MELSLLANHLFLKFYLIPLKIWLDLLNVQEHVIFPMAIEMIAKERISIKDGRVLVDGISSGEKKIICPH